MSSGYISKEIGELSMIKKYLLGKHGMGRSRGYHTFEYGAVLPSYTFRKRSEVNLLLGHGKEYL